MKTVLFGGGFDPPHIGHERALDTLLSRLAPDRVIVLPSGKPPHKALSGGADGEGRMAMCRAAFTRENVIFSDFDLKQEGKCYSFHALTHFREKDPDGEIILYCGTDEFLSFETWYRFEDILKIATLAVMSRDGDGAALTAKKTQLERDYHARILLLEETPVVVSSTKIRKEIGERGFSDHLSPKVNEIITRRGFYGSRLNDRRGAVLDRILSELDEERLSHTLGVERETVRLCELMGEDPEELRLGALLHDLTRRLPDGEQIAFLKQEGEEITKEDEASPAVLHGRCAARVAEREFGLDPVCCDAVRFHTTGRKGLTLPDKILFFADYIEETRRHKVCREARQAFYAGLPEGKDARLVWLDRCILSALNGTVSHLEERGKPVHPLTLSARDELARELP